MLFFARTSSFCIKHSIYLDVFLCGVVGKGGGVKAEPCRAEVWIKHFTCHGHISCWFWMSELHGQVYFLYQTQMSKIKYLTNWSIWNSKNKYATADACGCFCMDLFKRCHLKGLLTLYLNGPYHLKWALNDSLLLRHHREGLQPCGVIGFNSFVRTNIDRLERQC